MAALSASPAPPERTLTLPAVKLRAAPPPRRRRMPAAAVKAQAQRRASSQSSGLTPARSRPVHRSSAAAQRRPSRASSHSAGRQMSFPRARMFSPRHAHTLSTRLASGKSLAKPEMLVMAARSSWRSMSLSYSTVTSEPQIISRA